MKKLLKFAVCLTLLVMVVALFTGCKATGGGWFMSGCGEDATKCTFGFVAQGECDDFKGQFQFQEHNGKDSVKFHVDDMSLVLVAGPIAYFEGEDKDDLMVKVMVTDLGEPGTAGIGDLIAIDHETLGNWAGALEGGNIQVHPYK